jgi:hypothetical protein
VIALARSGERGAVLGVETPWKREGPSDDHRHLEARRETASSGTETVR